MMRFQRISLWAQAALYFASGVNHFVHNAFYVSIMPDHYAHPAGLVTASGVAEVAGGLGLLHPATRRFSAMGISIMLLVFLDVHVSMLRHPERFPGVPRWALWGRLPLQFVLVGWAWSAARRGR